MYIERQQQIADKNYFNDSFHNFSENFGWQERVQVVMWIAQRQFINHKRANKKGHGQMVGHLAKLIKPNN